MPGSHGSSLAPTELKQPLAWAFPAMAACLGRCTEHATATVREQGSAGWISLAQLAVHAMDTLDSVCGDAGIAWQQLGAD